MARVCQITGKAPMVGNNVSHANNKTKRRFLPNLQRRKFWLESENRWIRLRLTNAALRTIDKNGIEAVIADDDASVINDLSVLRKDNTGIDVSALFLDILDTTTGIVQSYSRVPSPARVGYRAGRERP